MLNTRFKNKYNMFSAHLPALILLNDGLIADLSPRPLEGEERPNFSRSLRIFDLQRYMRFYMRTDRRPGIPRSRLFERCLSAIPY
jgi:hypothetical protein